MADRSKAKVYTAGLQRLCVRILPSAWKSVLRVVCFQVEVSASS